MAKTGSRTIMDLIWSALVVLCLSYGLIVIGMYLLQDKLLYRTGAPAIPLESLDLGPVAEVLVSTDDGLQLRAWFAAPKTADLPTIVYFHGNAGTIGDRAYKARWFLDRGWGLIFVEYRGFGGNAGHPSEAGFYQDAKGSTDFAEAQGISASRLVLYGESLGTGVAVSEAKRLAGAGRPVGAVILEAPYTSIPAVAQRHYPYLPAKWLVRDQFDSLAKITMIQAPLLILHGDRDRVIPQEFGRILFKAAVEPKVARWLPGIGHNTVFEDGGHAAIEEFLSADDRHPPR